MGNKRDFTGAVDEKAADEIFGRPEVPPSPPASPNLIARPISIHEILPDPKQPRRLLPGALRYDRPLGDVLGDWMYMAEDESGRGIPFRELLRSEITSRSEDDQDEREMGPIETGFMKLLNLAATIRRDGGLINPVTIYRAGDGYRLETGERRWLAHHLLAVSLDEPQWVRMSAREVAAPSIWRQAHENTARDDLNAISLARQLALLVMDIYMEKGAVFEPYEHFGFDRHFYAQVADGFEFPVAYGDRERIIAAMGKSNVSQVNQYRALLRLPDSTWESADNENWTEGALREKLQEQREIERQVTEPEIQQVAESITTVRDHSSVQAQESDVAEIEGEPAEEADANALPDHIYNLLFHVYQRAAAALSEDGTWFSADNVTRSVDRLNQLIDDGLLEGRRPIQNRFSNTAYYRISRAGCEAIGKEELVYVYGSQLNHLPPGVDQSALNDSLTRPRSGGEVHAGTGSNTGSSPRRVTKQLFDHTERLDITTAMNLTDKWLDTDDGLKDAINALQMSIAAQQRKLDMLLLRKRA